MAAKCQKDWVSPHKVSLLILVKYISSRTTEEEHEIYADCLTICRDKLSLLLLEFFEAPDLNLCQLSQQLKIVDVRLPGLVIKSLHVLLENGISGISEFFESLEKLLAGQEPSLHKKSLFGLFTRRMILSFHKMSFSQVSHFVDLLRIYLQDDCTSVNIDMATDINGEGISIQIMENGEDESMTEKTRKPFLQGSVSNRQAKFFLAKQVSLIQSAEEKALSPPELQSRINSILAASPNIAEAHYASFFNCLRAKEFKEALDSLYHYFEQQQWQGESAFHANKPAGESEETEAERCHRFRYAALTLAALHCRFGHRQEAMAALKEAIQIAQETNDHVCLEHCLGWLYRLEQDGSPQAKQLLDRFVARASELKIPYLTSLGMLSHCQYEAMAGASPPKVLQNQLQMNIVNSQNSLTDLMTTAHIQQAATWQLYGKHCISGIFNQCSLQLNTSTRKDGLSSIDGSTMMQSAEATCLSLCSLAEQHADRGMFQEASDILTFCKSKFPKHSGQSRLWMATEARINYDRALLQGDMDKAHTYVEQLAAVDKSEADYRFALNMLHTGKYTEVLPFLQKLLENSREKVSLSGGKTSAAEYQTRVLLALTQLFLLLEDPVAALPNALNCLTLSCSHYLDHVAALASLHIAQIQLSLGLPTKAVNLVKRIMVQVLSHGSLYVQCCARFLLVKCQLAAPKHEEDKSRREYDLMQCALPALDTIVKGFRKLGAINKTRDALYYQAMVYDELGYTIERNACAAECCELLQRHPVHNTSSSLFVL
ncbi:anaphase-promoting complex subunit 5-like [Acropora palmata]|uniref:anaphase-promoting complex subunit 5-like n=1 Tax=Acropora palmata TaxID=6131 RepID=UPI003DA0EAB6